MKATYDPEVDIINIVLKDGMVDESRPGIVLDYNKEGEFISIEILDASRKTSNPRSFEYAVST